MRALLRGLVAMKGSLLAFLVTLGLAFLSFGYVSLALYVVVSPVLTLVFPPLDQWRGPWVWPVLVGVAILWSFSFIPAGILDLRLAARGVSAARRRLAYLAVLWLGALLAWFAMLGVSIPGPDGRERRDPDPPALDRSIGERRQP